MSLGSGTLWKVSLSRAAQLALILREGEAGQREVGILRHLVRGELGWGSRDVASSRAAVGSGGFQRSLASSPLSCAHQRPRLDSHTGF